MNDEAVLQVLEHAVMSQAKAQEEALDREIAAIDNLEEDDFEKLRERRKQALIKQHEKKQLWRNLGHGQVNELRDQPDFFAAMNGKSENVICLFYTTTNDYGKLFERHFQALCKDHLETKFCKIDAEKAPYLCSKMMIVLMPTVLLVKKGQVVHKIEGLDELGGDRFSTEWFEWYTSQFKVMTCNKPKPETPFVDGHEKFVNMERKDKGESIRSSAYHDDGEFSDEDFN